MEVDVGGGDKQALLPGETAVIPLPDSDVSLLVVPVPCSVVTAVPQPTPRSTPMLGKR